jgi:hypothetical protein
MSDKPWGKLNELDKALRRAFPVGMSKDQQGARCRIEMISGFELFNTRPYHNYETFSSGYRVSLPDGSFTASKEDLDDAIQALIDEIERRKHEDIATNTLPRS